MGRHEAQPGGAGRRRLVAAAAGAVVVALLVALLVITVVLRGGSDTATGPATGAGPSGTALPLSTGTGPSSPATPSTSPSSPSSPSTTGSPAGSGSPSMAMGPTLELRAVGTSWVQVRGPADRVLVARIFRKGDTATFRQRRLHVTLGNAGAVRLVANGMPVEPGRPGQVLLMTVVRGGD